MDRSAALHQLFRLPPGQVFIIMDWLCRMASAGLLRDSWRTFCGLMHENQAPNRTFLFFSILNDKVFRQHLTPVGMRVGTDDAHLAVFDLLRNENWQSPVSSGPFLMQIWLSFKCFLPQRLKASVPFWCDNYWDEVVRGGNYSPITGQRIEPGPWKERNHLQQREMKKTSPCFLVSQQWFWVFSTVFPALTFNRAGSSLVSWPGHLPLVKHTAAVKTPRGLMWLLGKKWLLLFESKKPNWSFLFFHLFMHFVALASVLCH